uniref:Mesencephalic astrocyte-derived neurotrophic factor homolog n=1 Tax=Romanomermis culicivorax TaxID=13658 RepID=A0A915ILI5_ROMCU
MTDINHEKAIGPLLNHRPMIKKPNIDLRIGRYRWSITTYTKDQSKKRERIPAEFVVYSTVCKTFLKKLTDELSEADLKSQDKIEARLLSSCKQTKVKKEQRFCWYIGAAHDSATRIINDVTKPLSIHFPVERVCEKLGQKDAQICELEYDKEIDWKTVDLNKLKVKDLKKILDEWGEQCKGCTEKSDYVSKIKELKPQHVKAEL